MQQRCAEKEAEAEALQARLVEAAVLAEKEAEDVEISGMHPPSHKAVADAATNTERRTYAQAAAQTQVREYVGGGGKGKGRGPSPGVVGARLWKI